MWHPPEDSAFFKKAPQRVGAYLILLDYPSFFKAPLNDPAWSYGFFRNASLTGWNLREKIRIRTGSSQTIVERVLTAMNRILSSGG